METLLRQSYQKNALDLVIMNEDLCMHSAIFKDGSNQLSFAHPHYIYKPKTEEKEMAVIIRCPVCRKVYEEASSRMESEIKRTMKEASEIAIRG